MIQGFSSLRLSLEVQLPWMGGWGKFLTSSFSSTLFRAPLIPPSSLCSNLPSLFSNALHQRVSRQAVLCGRQSFYSPLPPGSVCFLKVMVHWEKKNTPKPETCKEIIIWSAFLWALKVSDYIGSAQVFPCLCAVSSIAVDWRVSVSDLY